MPSLSPLRIIFVSQFPFGCVDQYLSGFAAWPGWAGGAAPGVALTFDQDQPASAEKKVKPQDPTDRSHLGYTPYGPDSFGMGIYGALGAYTGFDPSPPSSPALFWWMRKDPTIVLAHAAVCLRPCAGTRSVEIEDDKGNKSLAEEMKEAATKELLPLLDRGLFPSFECLQFGYWTQEVIWDRVGERLLPVELNSILPGEAQLYCDKQKKFAGFQIGQEFRDKRYAWHSVNLPHIHPVLGYARNESAKYDWWGKLQSNLAGDKIERKASGIQMLLGVPMGASFQEVYVDNGVQKTRQIWGKELCQRMIDYAVSGSTATYPLYAFKREDIIAHPELATLPGMKIDRFDWGNLGPMLEAGIKRLDYRNQQIFRAYCHPEREGIEGHHGTNAESETQTESIGVPDSERVHQERCTEFWEQLGKTWVRAIYGNDPKIPALKIKAAPLADVQQKFLQESALDLITDRNTGPLFMDHIDQRKLLEDVEMPMVDIDTAEANKDEREQQQAQLADAGQADPDGGDENGGLAGAAANVNAGANGAGKPLNGSAKKSEVDPKAIVARIKQRGRFNGRN